MIQIVKPQPPFTPEIGDFLFGPEFIHSYITKEETKAKDFLLFPLIFMNYWHPFSTLKKLGIDASELRTSCKYQCPFRHNTTFYGVFPFAIKTNDSKIYRQNDFALEAFDYAFDLEWQQRCIDQLMSVDQFSRAFMGHGFTDGTLPFDGGNSIVNVKLQLTNGDFILAHTWEWYNK